MGISRIGSGGGRALLALSLCCLGGAGGSGAQVTKYVRYSAAGKTSYGILEGDLIRNREQ